MTIGGEAQVFHPRSYLDLLSAHVQTQAGRRNPPTLVVIELYGPRLGWGHPQAQPAYSPYHASGGKLSMAQRLVPPASSGQDQRVVRVTHHYMGILVIAFLILTRPIPSSASGTFCLVVANTRSALGSPQMTAVGERAPPSRFSAPALLWSSLRGPRHLCSTWSLRILPLFLMFDHLPFATLLPFRGR